MVDVGRAALLTAGTAAATMVVDRALKVGAEHALDEGEAARGPLGIHLRRRTNDRAVGNVAGAERGAALGLAAGAGALALGVGAAGTLLHGPAVLRIGAGLVAGGMAANLIDRARGGGVTDYLVTPLGTLNAADVAIGAGIVLGGIGMVLR